MHEKKAFEEKVEAQLREWNTNLKQLKAMRDVVQGDAKITYEREIERLEHKRDEVFHALEELKLQKESVWKDLTDEIEHSINEMSIAFSKILKQVKSHH